MAEFLIKLHSDQYQYHRINLASLLINIIVILGSIFVILPEEKKVQDAINIRNIEITSFYDRATDKYTNPVRVEQLQREITEINKQTFPTALAKFLMLSIMTISMIGPLSTYLLWSFTKVNFLKKDEPNNYVLVTALIVVAFVLIELFKEIFKQIQ